MTSTDPLNIVHNPAADRFELEQDALWVAPLCLCVAGFIQKHPEYRDPI
jgi:hypothetical protein